MTAQRFEDIKVWQASQDFAVAIYDQFSSLKDYAFREQILKTSVAISNHIAEGFDRRIHEDFIRYLYRALNSNSEVRSMLYLSHRLDFANEEIANSLIDQSNKIAVMLFELINSINPALHS